MEENLKAFAELFPETVGPNGEAFLGWATSSDDALAHKVAYTDGQKVLDIIDKNIKLETDNVINKNKELEALIDYYRAYLNNN